MAVTSALVWALLASLIGLCGQCVYNNDISNIVLESCVRSGLERSNNTTHRNTRVYSLFEEYSDIWKSCASQVDEAECDDTQQRIHESRLEVIKSAIIDVWRDINKLMPTWEVERGAISDLCKGSLQYSLRTCLPMVKTYGFEVGKSDSKLLKSFMECITYELSLCEAGPREFLITNLWKNVRFSLFLSVREKETLKECLEIINLENFEKCAPGFFTFLTGLIFKDLSPKTVANLENIESCIYDVLMICDFKTIEIVGNILQSFFNITLSLSSNVLLRNTDFSGGFDLLPEDRVEIEKCFQTMDRSLADSCCPGLFEALQLIVEGASRVPEQMVFSPHVDNAACLGSVFKQCSGSMRFVVQNAIQKIFKRSLPVPFDRGSLLSRPGHFEYPTMELLFPHYNIPDEVRLEAKSCILKTFPLLVSCCQDLAQNVKNVLKDKSLNFPMEYQSDCVESCYQPAVSGCSATEYSYTSSLIKSVKLADEKLRKLEIPFLRPQPPYNLPGHIFTNIHACLQILNVQSLEKCCYGILKIFLVYFHDQWLPPRFITPDTCSYTCLRSATAICERHTAITLRAFMAFVIKMYENIQSPMEILNTCRDDEADLMTFSQLPELSKNAIKSCLTTIADTLDTCCPGLSPAILRLLEGLKIDANFMKMSLKWCTAFCYEPLVIRCENPHHTLQVIKTMLRVFNPQWESVPHIVAFNPDPPFLFPRDVSEGIKLCLMMVDTIPRQCYSLTKIMRAILYNEPWEDFLTEINFCHPKFYKHAIRDCPPEARDLTMGLMVSVIHRGEIAFSVQECLSAIFRDLEDCCPGMVKLIMSFFWTPSDYYRQMEDSLNKENCLIECSRRVLNNCTASAANIVEKVMKYLLDYVVVEQINFDYVQQYGPTPTGYTLNNLTSCSNAVYPIWEQCCPEMIAAFCTVVNKVSWPLDAPNLKRCNHFCVEPALKYCTPKEREYMLPFINYVKSYPTIGVEEYGNRCLAILTKALESCCPLLVLKVIQHKEDNVKRIYHNPVCSRICQVSVLKNCLRLKYLQLQFMIIIKQYVGEHFFLQGSSYFWQTFGWSEGHEGYWQGSQASLKGQTAAMVDGKSKVKGLREGTNWN